MRVFRSTALAAVAVAALAVPAAAAPAPSDPIPARIPVSTVRIALRTVATGLVAPVTGTVAPGDSRHLYVADQGGRIWGIDLRALPSRWLVADLSGLLVSNLAKNPSKSDERGLLGLAFDPLFRRNGLLYTFTTEDPTSPADFTTQRGVRAAGGQTVITQWRVRNRAAARVTVDPLSRRVMMRIDKPQTNHNGGSLVFGPDGKLYISLGDGGAADDQGPGHVRGGNGQSLAPGNVLGKVLRIDPQGRNSANRRYGIPLGNPFIGRVGADEIWAYGFRNPYRISFDRLNGNLLLGDVGQNAIEEVDVVRAGRNYGWPIKEGSFLFNNGGAGAGFVTRRSPGLPAGLVDPVLEYDHRAPGGVSQGIAVIGGYVYRGLAVTALRGQYVFGDYLRVGSAPLSGRLFVGRGSVVTSLRDPGIAVLGFAQDSSGELYVLGNKTGVLSGSTGTVLRITGPS